MTERELFIKIQEGDWDAFNAVFKRYSELLFHYSLGMVKNGEAARDIVQEVFIWLWTNRDKVPARDSINGYLFRAVKNACINHKVHEQVEQRYLRQQMIEEKGTAGHDDGEHDELFVRLQSLMDSLPPKCREIFIMGCVDGMSYKEIAGKLDISVNTVKTQIKTAYKKIKDNPAAKVFLLSILFR